LCCSRDSSPGVVTSLSCTVFNPPAFAALF
jgi:hypothetical protein